MSRKAGEIVTLAGISSVATSLGALAVSNKLFQISQAEVQSAWPTNYCQIATVVIS